MSPAQGHSAPTLLLLGATLALAVASLCIGPLLISPLTVFAHLAPADDSTIALIVRDIRLPRTVLAILVGASLGSAGAALQGLLRNPLSEPGIIGISGGAALGAVAAFYSGLASGAVWMLPASGMLGALLAVIAIHLLAGRGADILTVILAGVAINSLSGALTTLILNLSPNPFAAYEIYFWLLGSLANRGFDHVLLALPFMLAGFALLFATRRALDVLALGEDSAASLGINLSRTRAQVIAGSALAVGAAVSISGVIGFVGLVVPHLLRPWVGHRPGALLVPSALGGAALTLAADLGTRIPLAGGELKLGVVTALIGAPFFLRLVLQSRAGHR
ncbi:MAG: iron ABC transporter permease [Proteobacteria bacterium]|jgi:iron complex transport system permease protein|nr:iron ABC transporter permease [Pseudomonadota bacterium]